jgi:hypothetical protein
MARGGISVGATGAEGAGVFARWTIDGGGGVTGVGADILMGSAGGGIFLRK